MPVRTRDPKVLQLKELPIFASLRVKQLSMMAANLDFAVIEERQVMMTAGRHNHAFWIILKGRVELTIGGRVGEQLGPGDLFGLPSMFAGRDSTADVVALTEVEALVASHQQFNVLVADPEIAIRFKAAVFDRLRDEVYQLTRTSAAGH